jgi:hypothetical protein
MLADTDSVPMGAAAAAASAQDAQTCPLGQAGLRRDPHRSLNSLVGNKITEAEDHNG